MEWPPRRHHEVGHRQVDKVEVDGRPHGLVEHHREDDQNVPDTGQQD